MKRPTITAAKRVRIFEESDYRCVYCGEIASVLDHVTPFAAGGSSRDSNLVAACVSCNARASDKVFSSFTEKYMFLRLGERTASSMPPRPSKSETSEFEEPFIVEKRWTAHRKPRRLYANPIMPVEGRSLAAPQPQERAPDAPNMFEWRTEAE